MKFEDDLCGRGAEPQTRHACSTELLRGVIDQPREGLFVSQRDEGIDAHGAARGKIARGEGDERKQNGHAGKRREVVRGNAVE
jgi:hypothetical protein